MVDIEKIRIGDKLRVDLEVDEKDYAAKLIGVRPITGNRFFLSFPTVEAAEHIPAPKVFKRGDWVQHASCDGIIGGCPLGVGYVLEAEDKYVPKAKVFFAGWRAVEKEGKPGLVDWFLVEDLKIAENPE